MGGGRRQAAPESIGVCSAADDGDVKQVLLEVYQVSCIHSNSGKPSEDGGVKQDTTALECRVSLVAKLVLQL